MSTVGVTQKNGSPIGLLANITLSALNTVAFVSSEVMRKLFNIVDNPVHSFTL